jgi:UDP-N-acetylglucosamine 2-epimerase (non-hydrolysing)
MLDSVLEAFDIIPDYDLSIMKPSQTLSYITETVIHGIDRVIKEFKPDTVIVHGDTSTAFAGALSAFYNGVQIAHVEAGLRSNNISSPFPEEFNRKAISLIASLNLAPTKSAVNNLLREGVEKSKIFPVGNTVIDALNLSLCQSQRFELPAAPYILMTLHRRERTDSEILSVFRAIRRICIDDPSISVIYPIHKNPRFIRLFTQVLGDVKNAIICEPLPVVKFHRVLQNCHLVLTDSGGIQEEAAYLGKPVLVARDNTERPEAVECGCEILIGTYEEKIYAEVSRLLNDRDEYDRRAIRCNDFGEGDASQKIIEILKSV